MQEVQPQSLQPYLILAETTTQDQLNALSKELNIALDFQWRYYYQYQDAIRLIDFVETRGIYDGWVVLAAPKDWAVLDAWAKKHPSECSYFEPQQKAFLEGLETPVLEQLLGSVQLTGRSLDWTLEILKSHGKTYTNTDVMERKTQLQQQHLEGKGKARKVIMGIYLLLFGLAALYFWWILG